MSILILLILGGALGAFASVMFSAAPRALNILAGMFGALMGGWLLAPLFGGHVLDADTVTAGSLLEAALGAVALIVVLQLVRKGMSNEDDSHGGR